MNPKGQAPPAKLTARRYVAAILAREILSSPESKDFAIASEHQLCRRFAISRVTVRLALGDLEHKGLIYRRHGKGTFAHGASTRIHRSIGILINSVDLLKQPWLIEMIRGVLAVISPLDSALMLINSSPTKWQSEMTRSLAGVIVVQEEITVEELAIFKKYNVPFACHRESQLADKVCDFFGIGQRTAHALNYASLTGESGQEIKVSGVNSTLSLADSQDERSKDQMPSV